MGTPPPPLSPCASLAHYGSLAAWMHHSDTQMPTGRWAGCVGTEMSHQMCHSLGLVLESSGLRLG